MTITLWIKESSHWKNQKKKTSLTRPEFWAAATQLKVWCGSGRAFFSPPRSRIQKEAKKNNKKTRLSCNTSNRGYVHNSSLLGDCSSVFSLVSKPILFSSCAFCSEVDWVNSESHDVTKERALLMAPPAIEKEKIYDHGRSGFYLKHFKLANHNTLLLSNGPIFYRFRRKINVAADKGEKTRATKLRLV